MVLWLLAATGLFSTKSTWQAIRSKHSTVRWHKLVWFPTAIPKCGFILWLALQGRLGTQDRLHIDSSNMKCLLCQICLETHDHLFFICTFSKHIWEGLSLLCDIPHRDMPWEERIVQMIGLCKGKSYQVIIRKLCLAAAIYHIWQERNNRFHEGSYRDASFVRRTIVDLIRWRLFSSKGIQNIAVNRIL